MRAVALVAAHALARGLSAAVDAAAKTVRHEHMADAKAAVSCPEGQYDSRQGEAFITRGFGSKSDCLPCEVDLDGTVNLQWISVAAKCFACELRPQKDGAKVPQCTSCAFPEQALLADELGRVRCYDRPPIAGRGGGDLCAAAVQTRELPPVLRPLQQAAVWDLSWDQGTSWQRHPVRLNDMQVLLDDAETKQRPRTAVQKARELGFTPQSFPESPIRHGAHVVMVTIFPPAASVKAELVTLTAGASLVEGARSAALLVDPADVLVGDGGLVALVGSTTSAYGPTATWRFDRGLVDLLGHFQGGGRVPPPLVRSTAADLAALGGCVELVQQGEATGRLAAQALDAAAALREELREEAEARKRRTQARKPARGAWQEQLAEARKEARKEPFAWVY